jgi:predicted permease
VRLWHILQSRLRSIFFRGRRESDLSEELQLHLDREIERLQASGLSREDARFQARRLFGGVEQIKEAARDARGTGAWDALVRDTRHGLRRLVRDWRFTTAAVLILGIAIGANAAIFSVVNAVLFRKEAFADPDRLVNIYQNDAAGKPMIVTSYAAYMEMADYTDVFAATMASSIPNPVRYLHDGAVRNAVAEFATPNYLEVLRLRPSLGRWFDETETRTGSAVVAVVGYQAWTRLFRADPSILGRVIRMEGVPVTIIGIGPPNHRGTIDMGLGTDFWLPITAIPKVLGDLGPRGAPTIIAPLLVKARLREGVALTQAKAAMDVLARRLAAEHPEQFRNKGEFAIGPGITVIPSTDVRIHPQADVPFMALASLVLVIVGLVLAIACSNLATLLLVRGATRAKEVSVRLAMGATRRQLVRHLLTESLLLSLAGGIAGCLLAWWAMRVLQAIDLPFRVDLTLDYRVLAFAIGLSLVTGVAFGLAPAFKATKIDLLPTLRDEGLPPLDHRRLTLKNALIVVQVAISVLLLGTTSIFLQATAAARALRVGYAVDGVAMLEPIGGLLATRKAQRRPHTTICCAGSRPFPASNPRRCCAACRWRPLACRSSWTARRVNQDRKSNSTCSKPDQGFSRRCAFRFCTAACSMRVTAPTRHVSP